MLEIRNLEVVYHGVVLVLRGVSLRVASGQVVALLGPNGAGKTTVLRAITGLLPIHEGVITKGSIEWEGAPLTNLGAQEIVSRGLLQVMEGRRIFAELSVEDNLLAGAMRRRNRADVKNDLAGFYERFPALAARRTQQAGYLSGGEQQMLAIARALMGRPRLLLLDEPSLGLAPKIVADVAELIRSVHAEGVSVLLIEQNAGMALDLADYAYVLENGRIVVDGTSDVLREDEDVRDFYLGVGGARSYRDVKHYRRRKRWLS